MSNSYLEYLNSLSKEKLINLIYEPKRKSIPFPFKSYRNVALRMSYEGANYKGVQQHNTIKSIGNELAASLEITGIGHSPVYCGRTDAGVSALAMIVSLQVKSRFETPNRSYQKCDQDYEEYPFDKIINERLPNDIRITGWAPVPDEFSARYTCIERHYRYYFVLNEMNLEKMREACDKIKKMNNFYELSTHSNPKAKYARKINFLEIKKAEKQYSISTDLNEKEDHLIIKKIESANQLKSSDLYYMEIKAYSFLHNMVRKIFWVIQNCGKGNEFTLKNVEIADSKNLLFVSGKFPEELKFIYNKFNLDYFKERENQMRILHTISALKYQEIHEESQKNTQN